MKMPILPKAIYRFITSPIKISTQFLTDLERTILNFIWKKTKKTRKAETILYNERKILELSQSLTSSGCLQEPESVNYRCPDGLSGMLQ